MIEDLDEHAIALVTGGTRFPTWPDVPGPGPLPRPRPFPFPPMPRPEPFPMPMPGGDTFN